MNAETVDSERILRLSHFTFDRAVNAIYWVDSDARIHHVNETACKKLGYSRKELLSLTFHDIDPDYQKDDWQAFRSNTKRHKTLSFESYHKAKDGNMFPVEVTSNFIEFEGKEYSCCFVRDITERKNAEKVIRESEKRFRDIFNAVNDAIFIIDPDTQRIVETNKIALDLLGYSQSEITGLHVKEIHPKEMKQLEKTLGLVLSGRPVLTDEFSCLRKDKKRVPADMSFSQVELDGKLHIMAMVRDVTERKQAEKALQHALIEVERLKNRLQAENVYLQEEIKIDHNFEEIISRSDELKRELQKVEQVASTDSTVLILGETGTGKELFARAVHNISARRERPLVKVNCATLPANLIESELFGHEKGAFTGALSRKIGRFELADGGTIFLDEIGDLPLDLQSKLLRVLQEGEFERLGNPNTLKVNVRIISATNRDIVQEVENGKFREDLYYRLNVFPIRIPPLRDRKEDIPLLIKYFVRKYSAIIGRKIESVPQKLIDTLRSYRWPGNVRELENIIERAVIISQGPKLELGDWLQKNGALSESSRTATLNDREKEYIVEVLESTGWRVRGENGAAKLLGLKPTTLEARMKKLGISRNT